MPTMTEARDALVKLIEDDMSVTHPNVQRHYQNTGTLDPDTMDSMYLFVKIDFVASNQITLGHTPYDRTFGILSLDIRDKVGAGTRPALVLADHLKKLTKHKTVSGVTLKTPNLQELENLGAWACHELLVEFWFDSIP